MYGFLVKMQCFSLFFVFSFFFHCVNRSCYCYVCFCYVSKLRCSPFWVLCLKWTTLSERRLQKFWPVVFLLGPTNAWDVLYNNVDSFHVSHLKFFHRCVLCYFVTFIFRYTIYIALMKDVLLMSGTKRAFSINVAVTQWLGALAAIQLRIENFWKSC